MKVIPFEERESIVRRICDLREMRVRHSPEDEWILKLGPGFESKLFSKSPTKVEGRLTLSLISFILRMSGIVDVEIDPELGADGMRLDPVPWSNE